MKFALVEGQRREAERKLSGECPVCNSAVIAKCGQLRVRHWAHRGVRTCDRWWEPETAWHRDWKNHFPMGWQEFVHTASDGERHVADVKTESGVVIEFQHSFLHPEERSSREAFYPKMVWIVDGRRRVRDVTKFFASLAAPVAVGNFRMFPVLWNECALLRDWEASRAPLYFDFGDAGQGGASILWRRISSSRDGKAHILGLPKALFLSAHRAGLPLEQESTEAVERAVNALIQQASRSQPLVSFERYMARKRHGRRRF